MYCCKETVPENAISVPGCGFYNATIGEPINGLDTVPAEFE